MIILSAGTAISRRGTAFSSSLASFFKALVWPSSNCGPVNEEEEMWSDFQSILEALIVSGLFIFGFSHSFFFAFLRSTIISDKGFMNLFVLRFFLRLKIFFSMGSRFSILCPSVGLLTV